jgi:hypothetical protein
MSIRKIISESGSILFWESCWINFALDRAVRRIKAISARNQWGVISHNFSNYCDCISITRIFPAPPGGIATSWARSKSRAKGTTLAPPQSHLYKPLRIRKEHQISRFTQSKNFLLFNRKELKRKHVYYPNYHPINRPRLRNRPNSRPFLAIQSPTSFHWKPRKHKEIFSISQANCLQQIPARAARSRL